MPREKKSLSEWPTDLVLTPLLSQFAATIGLDPEAEWEAFHDSALANGRRYADWRAAFRTWCRNAAKWKADRTPGADIHINTFRPSGFTASVFGVNVTPEKMRRLSQPQPEAVRAALRDNEEAARETASMTTEQKQAALRKLGEIWRSIK